MKQKIVLIVSVAVGLLAAVLTRGYLAAKEGEYNAMKAKFNATHGVMYVVCFKKDVPSGTVIDEKMLEPRVVNLQTVLRELRTLLRRLIGASQEISRMSYQQQDLLPDILNRSEKLIFDIAMRQGLGAELEGAGLVEHQQPVEPGSGGAGGDRQIFVADHAKLKAGYQTHENASFSTAVRLRERVGRV